MEWTSGVDWWTGLVEWTGGHTHHTQVEWTIVEWRLVEWTSGMDW